MRIDEFKAMIQEIVSEELDNVLLNEAKKREPMKRGQRKSKRTGRAVYSSAGTIPSSQPDKAGRPAKSKVDPDKRRAEGQKLFNLYQRGDARGGTKAKDQKAIKFRKQVNKRAKQEYGSPITADEKNSVIWSIASVKSRIASNIDNTAPGSKRGRTKIQKPGGKKRRAASRKDKRDRLKAAARDAAQKAAAKAARAAARANKKSTP